MKKYCLAMAALIAACGFASAADEVLSKNAVGYVKVTVPAGEYMILGTDFATMDGSIATVESVFGTDGIPFGTKVSVFTGDDYDDSAYSPLGWSEPDLQLPLGEGFWVKGGSTDMDVYLMGEVPADDVEVSLLEGYQMVAYPYPVSKKMSETGFFTNPDFGDKVSIWDGSISDYVDSAYSPLGWSKDLTFEPGSAFWYKSSADKSWTETKPYMWP